MQLCTKYQRVVLFGVQIALVLIILVAQSGTSSADNIALEQFRGPQSAKIQNRIKGILKRHGHRVIVVKSIGSESVPIQAYLQVTLGKHKKRWKLKIEVLNGSDQQALGSTSWVARRPNALPRIVAKQFWRRLGKYLEQTVEEEVEEESEEPEEVEESEESTEREEIAKSDSKTIDLGVSIGTRIFSRDYSYQQDSSNALSSFTVNTVLALEFELDYYPIKNVGVAASYSFTPEFNTITDDGVKNNYPTQASAYRIGLRGRYTLSKLVTRLDVDYGAHDFSIGDAGAVAKPAIPDVAYRFVRIGAAALAAVTPELELGVQAAYRHVLSSGEISADEYFPRLSAKGVDGLLHVGYQFLPHFQAQLQLRVEQYFFSMNSRAGDTPMADGATDRRLGGLLLVRYQL